MKKTLYFIIALTYILCLACSIFIFSKPQVQSMLVQAVPSVLNMTSNFTSNILRAILFIVVFFILLFSVIGIYYYFTSDAELKKKYPKLSIIGIMRKRKFKETIRNIVIVLGFSLGYIILTYYLQLLLNIQIIDICLLTTLLLAANHIVLNFRIGKGFYGNNEREAREIINFIIDESENIDFTDNGKFKKIVGDSDLDEFEKTITRTWKPEYR